MKYLLLAIFLMVSGLSIVALAPGDTVAITPTEDCTEPWEREVAHLVNEERASRGLNRLYISNTLAASGEHFVQDMSHNGWDGSHTMSNGVDWGQNQRNHGYTFNTWRGNVLAASYSSPAAVVFGWMASPSHRDILLKPEAVVIGVGYTGYNGKWWAADFGGYGDTKATDC